MIKARVSGRQHKAWGVSPRSWRRIEYQPALAGESAAVEVWGEYYEDAVARFTG